MFLASHTPFQPITGIVVDIERLTEGKLNFRQVLYTGKNLQLVLMTIQPSDEIGEEVQVDRDQFFRVESGEGEAWIDRTRMHFKNEDGFIVPAGAKHNVVNTGTTILRLYTIYGPPEHRDGTVHTTSVEAKAFSERFDGKTTE